MSSDVSSPSSLSSKKAKLQNPRGVGGEQRQEKEDQLEEEEVKIKTEFRNVFYSTSKDISDVCGPRVRFTCIDCNERVVALGANTGSVYCFARTYVEKKTKKKKDGDKEEEEKKNSSVSSTEEGRLRFLAVISPQSIKRTDAQTGRTMVTSQVIQKVKLSPDGNMAAIAYASGVLHVISFKSGSSNNSSNSSTPPAGRTIALLRKAHASQIITALTWSNDGNVVYCGDDAGMGTRARRDARFRVRRDEDWIVRWSGVRAVRDVVRGVEDVRWKRRRDVLRALGGDHRVRGVGAVRGGVSGRVRGSRRGETREGEACDGVEGARGQVQGRVVVNVEKS